MALYSFTTGYFPVDPSKRSSSAVHRQCKYITDKDFVMLMPGLALNDIGKKCIDIENHDISVKHSIISSPVDAVTPSSELDILNEDVTDNQSLNSQSDPNLPSFASRVMNPEVKSRNIDYYISRFHETRQRSDYGFDLDDTSETDEFWHNWYRVFKGNCYPIIVKSYSDLLNINEEQLLRSCFCNFVIIDYQKRTYDLAILRRFFRSDEEWKVWSTLYYVDMNYIKAAEIWRANLLTYISHLPGELQNLTTFWKVKNPGEQRFGQNRPTPMTAREYYGPTYIPTIAGISCEIYFLIKMWLTNNSTICKQACPRDVLKCIMQTIIADCEYEVLKVLGFAKQK